jgi:NAD-dependent protein deacetylases, SIR2 family
MGSKASVPCAAQAEQLRGEVDQNCGRAAAALASADVLVLLTGAGFSADSGLATYHDVARIPTSRKGRGTN